MNATTASVSGLVGREREYDQLAALLDAATAQRCGGAVAISGEPGIGKTALVRAIVGQARRSGWAVLEGHGYDLEGRLSYGPLAAALSAYLHRLPPARRSSYCAGLASLGALVEGLGPAPDGTAERDAPDPGRSRLFQAVALLLGRIAADSPVLFVVDDLHWADPATVEVLTYLAADLDALGVVLLVTQRTPPARPDVRRLVAALARVRLHVEVTLRRLGPDGVVALAGQVLGGAVNPGLAELLTRRSAGTPLVVHALLHDLRGRAVLADGAGGWRCTEPDPDVPDHLLELFGAGLERLHSAARRALEVVCLGGAPVQQAQLVALTGCSRLELATATDTLRGAGLLHEDAQHGQVRYSPAHPLVGDAVLARLGEVSRTAIHARYVEVLQAEGVRGGDVLARHHLGAGGLVAAARTHEVLAAAGRAALRRGAPASAVRWLGAAADLAAPEVPSVARGELLVDLGVAWQSCADTPSAMTTLHRAAEVLREAGELRKAAIAAGTAARFALMIDDVTGARRSSTLAVELAAVADAAVRVRTAQMRALLLGDLGDTAEAIRVLDGADREIARVEDAGTRERLTGLTAYGRLAAGSGDAAATLRLLTPRTPCPDETLELTCSNARVELVVLLGRWSDLDGELAAARALGERGPGPVRLWRSPLAEFHRMWSTGDWDTAEDLLTEWSGAPGPAREVELHAMRRWVALHRGEIAGPADIGDPVDVDGEPIEVGRLSRPVLEVVRALAAARSGRRVDAPGPTWLMMFEWWRRLARVETLAAAKDVRGLLAEATDLHRIGGAGTAPAALAERARALGSSDRAVAARHAARAATAFDALGMPVDAATVRIEAAERGCRTDPDRLRADLALAERLGARPLAHRAGRLLGRSSGPSTAHPELTPREREVAELVADGLSNAAIAERLVVSVRTVTSHLDHAYTKLGIRSRTELAREIRWAR